jgi:hypothetical protein
MIFSFQKNLFDQMVASFYIFMPDVPAAGRALIIRLNAILSLDIHQVFEGRGASGSRGESLNKTKWGVTRV